MVAVSCSSVRCDWCPYFYFYFGLVYILRDLQSVLRELPLVGCPCTGTHQEKRSGGVPSGVLFVFYTRDRVSILDDLWSSPAQRYAEGSQTHQERVKWYKLSGSWSQWFQTLCSGKKVISDIVFNLSPDVVSKPHIWVMTPPKFANDWIEDSTKDPS